MFPVVAGTMEQMYLCAPKESSFKESDAETSLV
jgi:hypothetical protein